MTRSRAIAYASEYFDSGAFQADLTRRVAFRTESGVPEHRQDLFAYLEQEIVPAAARLGAVARVADNPAGGGPLLLARRHEGDHLPTVLTYGHGDVVTAEPRRWRRGLDPWRVTVEQDRWYGRGTADNKGPTAHRPPCCPTSAAACPMTSSPISSGCPPSGSRTPIRPAPSTHRTSTSSRRSPARRCGSWRACSGTWANARPPATA